MYAARVSPLVLIVDDERPNLESLGKIFEREGWRVAQASSGAEANSPPLGIGGATPTTNRMESRPTETMPRVAIITPTMATSTVGFGRPPQGALAGYGAGLRHHRPRR